MLALAIPRGRVLEQCGDVLRMLGATISTLDAGLPRRALLMRTTSRSVAVAVLRCSDVVDFVRRGYVSAGIVGGDVVRESRLCVASPLDIRISQCRMSLALRSPLDVMHPYKLRVATKYPNAVRAFLGARDSVAYVSLHGGMEVAPLLGASDVVADIVDTGTTLAAHGLSEVRRVAAVSARLVLNACLARIKARAMRIVTDMLRLASEHL
ncbi:ATP phosphoribosyltransferase [Candidatus Tremblaya princeps]|uniref:ATP phosphoribosyltransferase n=1 Tax=Tremblaya princeps TaxID=189385 RepID=A0A143WNR9_TREPR|nr:ATP phosphoribosyltransferase [Candidatus Tremblaya princeps]